MSAAQTTLSAFQRETVAESGPEPEDEPDCHHDPCWYESGTCMVCNPHSGASLDRDLKRELTKDSMGGVL